MKKWLVVVLGLMMLLVVGCQQESEKSVDPDELTKIQFVLDWTPNTNHTGLYVARDKGYFKEQGLEVEILQPGEAGADQLVASGKAQFGISAQEALTHARLQGVPLVSLAAVLQHNTSGFAAPKQVGLRSPKDFEGKTYGGWGAPIEVALLETLMEQNGGAAEKVNIVNAGNMDFFNMQAQGVDFSWIYYGWTGVEAELRGQDIDMLYLTDYATELDYYTPIIVTNERYIKENEDTVRKFMAAVAKGYQYAIDEPKEAAAVLSAAVPELDAELVEASAIWLAEHYQGDAARWGEQSLAVWTNFADWMAEHELITEPFDAEKAFTNEFLPEEAK